MHEHDLHSADGTRIRGWRSGDRGPDVLLSPGLGTIPEAWPALLLPDSGVRVISWYHRGTMGSDRPADESRIRLDDHVADAVAVMDAAGVRRCVVMGWSVGVMVACELARRHPERVAGLLLAAGVPGDLFGAMFAPPGLPTAVPKAVRRTLALGIARAVRTAAPVVDAVLHRVPVTELTATLMQHSGFMLPSGNRSDVAAAVRRFVRHDARWYTTLALALADVPEPDLRGIDCPVTVLAGRYDILADPVSATAPFSSLPQARTRLLPTTHFLPLEAPDVIVAELTALTSRVAAVEEARTALRPRRFAQPLDALIPPVPALTSGSPERT